MSELDAVVVGAGLAGLFAARTLVSHGANVAVVESRDRVGGRTLTHTLGTGDTIDLGAQWIGPGQDRMVALARELGVGTFQQYSKGRKVLGLGPKIKTYKGTIPWVSPLGLADLQMNIWRIDAMMKKVPLDNPASAPKAREWDSQTVESWKNANLKTEASKALLDIAVRSIFCVEPSDLSFLHFLFYLRSGSGLMKLAAIEDGAQQTRMIPGTQALSLRMAEALGDRVILNAPVRSIRQDDNGVVVKTDDRELRAKRVIVAIPPALAARIDYSPTLPAARDELSQRMPMGSVIKCIAVYREPFWRTKGFSGEAIADTGAVRLVMDDSPEDASHGALVGFFLGDEARKWTGRDRSARREAALESFARYFGPKAREAIEYIDLDWPAEAWSRGCYVGIMGPGVMTSVGHALRTPVGRIHWAGTETAEVWNGYMDGALESGERAAQEVLRGVGR